jgi:hypothetical protein
MSKLVSYPVQLVSCPVPLHRMSTVYQGPPNQISPPPCENYRFTFSQSGCRHASILHLFLPFWQTFLPFNYLCLITFHLSSFSFTFSTSSFPHFIFFPKMTWAEKKYMFVRQAVQLQKTFITFIH